MTLTVAVVGTGPRAAGWATRFAAAGLDVIVDDPTVPAEVVQRWPMAQRLGLFPGASPARVRLADDASELARADLVQVIGTATAPPGARLVATDATAHAYEPIHVVPLVALRAGPRDDDLRVFYTSIGMVPCGPDTPTEQTQRLGQGLVDLTGGDPTAIVAVMRSLRPSGIGAGAAVAAHEARRLASEAPARWRIGDAIGAPLELYTTFVEPDWVDYNDHMTEAAYLTAAGWASDALFRYIGDDEAYRAAGHSFYTVETHVHYLHEVNVDEPLLFRTHLLGADAKRMHLVHHMHHGLTDGLLSSVEQMLVHVDTEAGRSALIPDDMAAAIFAIVDAHSAAPAPSHVGSVMRLPQRT